MNLSVPVFLLICIAALSVVLTVCCVLFANRRPRDPDRKSRDTGAGRRDQ